MAIGGVATVTGGVVPSAFAYSCGKLIVAYAPTLSADAVLVLDPQERSVFESVDTRSYFTGTLGIAGPLNDGGAFNLLNLGLTTTFGTPVLPSVTQITRGLPYGPAQIKASSETPLSLQQTRAVINAQLTHMPPSLLTSTVLEDLILHVFQPYFSVEALSTQPIGAYGRLRELQGYRSTYWIGSLRNFAVTFLLWDQSEVFVAANFPAKSLVASNDLARDLVPATSSATSLMELSPLGQLIAAAL